MSSSFRNLFNNPRLHEQKGDSIKDTHEQDNSWQEIAKILTESERSVPAEEEDIIIESATQHIEAIPDHNLYESIENNDDSELTLEEIEYKNHILNLKAKYIEEQQRAEEQRIIDERNRQILQEKQEYKQLIAETNNQLQDLFANYREQILTEYYSVCEKQKEQFGKQFNESTEILDNILNERFENLSRAITEYCTDLTGKSLDEVRTRLTEDLTAVTNVLSEQTVSEHFLKEVEAFNCNISSIIANHEQNLTELTASKISEINESTDLNRLSEGARKYTDKQVAIASQEAKDYARRILELGGGGGSVAQQFTGKIVYTAGSGTGSIQPTIGFNTASGNYSTITGGLCSCSIGFATFVGAGSGHRATGLYSTIGGGAGNCTQLDWTTVAGGLNNRSTNYYSTVAGGTSNIAGGNAAYIGGGNQNCAGADWSVVNGGLQNCICAFNSINTVIGGGCINQIGNSTNPITKGSAIGGGLGNYIPNFGATIAGGYYNHIGGYKPLAAASSNVNTISGNGTCTLLNFNTSLNNCIPTTPFATGDSVAITWSTSTVGTWLSGATYATATVVSYLNNTCIIVNGDYSSCTSSGLSAAQLYAYDKNLNINNCGQFIGGGSTNTASGLYSAIAGGNRNITSGNQTFIGSGCGNCASGGYSTVSGGYRNTNNAFLGFIGSGNQNNIQGNASVIGGGDRNSVSVCAGTIGGGGSNAVYGCYGSVVGGCGNQVMAPSLYSTTAGGRANYNGSFSSFIGNGEFNHTGGYLPINVTNAASISGNGACTLLTLGADYSTQFCGTGTNATSLAVVWTAPTGAFSTLSAACAQQQNILTNVTNGGNTCLIFNGDYSRCSATSLSATSIWVYDICVNTATTCFNAIGGGMLNTASGCYSVVAGGKNNIASGRAAAVVGGDFACATGNGSFIGAGRGNKATGVYSTASGGYNNNASGGWSVIGGGNANNASGNYSTVNGGSNNTASGLYSFIAAGSANNTGGYANTFILGSNITAPSANYTYVNNLSSQGTVFGECHAFGSSSIVNSNTTTQAGCKIQIFNSAGASLGYIQVYSS